MHLFLVLISIILFPISGMAELTPISEIISPNPSLYPADLYYKVAVLQWAPQRPTPINVSVEEVNRFKAEVREELLAFIQEAALKEVKLIVTPEFSTVGYPETEDGSDNFGSPQEIAPYAEFTDGPTFKYFSKVARQYQIAIVVSIAEKTQNTGEYFNTALYISSSGQLLGSYRKMNLFGRESHFLKWGSAPLIIETPMGKTAIAICADLYGSMPMGDYKKIGIDVLITPVSWTIHNSAYAYYKRAALNLKAFVVAANHSYFPDSGVVNFDGTKQSHIRQSQGLAYGFIPLKKVGNKVTTF